MVDVFRGASSRTSAGGPCGFDKTGCGDVMLTFARGGGLLTSSERPWPPPENKDPRSERLPKLSNFGNVLMASVSSSFMPMSAGASLSANPASTCKKWPFNLCLLRGGKWCKHRPHQEHPVQAARKNLLGLHVACPRHPESLLQVTVLQG